jgi:hypothetical protein
MGANPLSIQLQGATHRVYLAKTECQNFQAKCMYLELNSVKIVSTNLFQVQQIVIKFCDLSPQIKFFFLLKM